MNDLYQYDITIFQQNSLRMAGIDEAGRGSLAGPVVAAVVELDLNNPIEGVNDSKKLTPKRRTELYDKITNGAKHYGVGMASPKEIDYMNILQATFLAMRRAVMDILGASPNGSIGRHYELLLVDGNQHIVGLPRERQKPIVGGDALSASVAAASIIAKVTRDRIMERYHAEYPQYDFAKHKGYGTEKHRYLISQHGLCEIHRKTFCKNIF